MDKMTWSLAPIPGGTLRNILWERHPVLAKTLADDLMGLFHFQVLWCIITTIQQLESHILVSTWKQTPSEQFGHPAWKSGLVSLLRSCSSPRLLCLLLPFAFEGSLHRGHYHLHREFFHFSPHSKDVAVKVHWHGSLFSWKLKVPSAFDFKPIYFHESNR